MQRTCRCEQGRLTSAHVRDLMAPACANGLGTITNLEKMAAFLKSFVWFPLYGEKVEPHRKRWKDIFTLVPSTIDRHIHMMLRLRKLENFLSLFISVYLYVILLQN